MCGSDSGNSVFESIVDVSTQWMTGGLAGYKSDEGGLTTGIVGKEALKGLKEVTGAAAAEEANKLAREQAEEAKTRALEEREDIKARSAAEQLAKSRQAGTVRSTSGRGISTPVSSVGSDLGSDERDFLGL